MSGSTDPTHGPSTLFKVNGQGEEGREDPWGKRFCRSLSYNGESGATSPPSSYRLMTFAEFLISSSRNKARKFEQAFFFLLLPSHPSIYSNMVSLGRPSSEAALRSGLPEGSFG